MRIKGAGAVHYDSGPNMTPLVDVVMVILIFLMLAGSFSGADHYLQSNIPFTGTGAGQVAPPPGFVPDEPLVIDVSAPVPGHWVARVGQIQVDNLDELVAQLSGMRQGFVKSGTPIDKVIVVVSPMRNVKYQSVIDVYQAALTAEFTKVSFANPR
jgi:biopolymer transport protein ExbD